MTDQSSEGSQFHLDVTPPPSSNLSNEIESGGLDRQDIAYKSVLTKSLPPDEATKLLAEITNPEALHIWFDKIVEARLGELDPEYMKTVNKAYGDRNRWYA